jgi:hypothetical protein
MLRMVCACKGCVAPLFACWRWAGRGPFVAAPSCVRARDHVPALWWPAFTAVSAVHFAAAPLGGNHGLHAVDVECGLCCVGAVWAGALQGRQMPHAARLTGGLPFEPCIRCVLGLSPATCWLCRLLRCTEGCKGRAALGLWGRQGVGVCRVGWKEAARGSCTAPSDALGVWGKRVASVGG